MKLREKITTLQGGTVYARVSASSCVLNTFSASQTSDVHPEYFYSQSSLTYAHSLTPALFSLTIDISFKQYHVMSPLHTHTAYTSVLRK